MTTHYNIYFNGNESYKKGLLTLEGKHKDDYSKVLPIYGIGTEEDAQAVFPDMDRAIEKSLKSIKQHSMRIRGREKNDWIDDAYMLIGKARFHKREYLGALEAFNYVVQEFPKEEIYFDAILWAARTQTEMENFYSAGSDFDALYENPRLPKRLNAEVKALYAELKIKEKQYPEAITYLSEAIKESRKKKKRVRYSYILAQIHELQGNNYEASQHYEKVIKMNPSYEMEFYAQLSRARTFDAYQQDSRQLIKDLKKMLKDSKNKEYQDQIYYVLAEISLKEQEHDDAIEYLKKSTKASINNKSQKGLSFLLLADIFFDFAEYVDAQTYYDSTVSFLPEDHLKFKEAKRKKESLEDLVKHVRTIQLEDSLQNLAKLSEKELRNIIDDIIDELKEEEERKKEALENGNLNLPTPVNTGSNTGTAASGAWYFYNAAALSSGVSQFVSNWGNRKLEDNWRRKNKTVQQINTSSGEQGELSDSTVTTTSTDKYDPDYYLSKIPLKESQLKASNERLAEAYYSLGVIYKEQLRNYKKAIKSFETLVKRFPKSEYEVPAYYNLYRLHLMLENNKEAEKYKNILLTDFPNSIYSRQIRNPDKVIEDESANKEAEKYYRETYALYQSGTYKKVVKRAEKAQLQFPDNSLLPQFALLRSLSIGNQRQEEPFVSSLKEIITNYPSDPVAKQARNILSRIRGTKESNEASKYKYEPTAKHSYILIFPNKIRSVNQIKNGVTDFNKKYFGLEKLAFKNIFLDQNHQLIIISGFANMKKAMTYYGTIKNKGNLPQLVKGASYQHFAISDKNAKTFYKDKNIEEYQEYFKENYENN